MEERKKNNNVLYLILCVLLIVGLFFMIRKVQNIRAKEGEKLERQQIEYAARLEAEKKAIAEVAAEATASETANIEAVEGAMQETIPVKMVERGNVYERLKRGEPVNILVIGGSIAAGAGASDEAHSYASIISEKLQSSYGSQVTLTNLAMEAGNGNYAGYIRTMLLDDGNEYDLAIICSGYYDSEIGFSKTYERTIRAVSNRYPGCSIITVLESAQRILTPKITAVQTLSEYYNIPTVDMLTKFEDDYEALVTNDLINPNDKGNVLYAECIKAVIDKQVENNSGKPDYDKVPVNEILESMGEVRYIGKEEFTRTDDLTYTINTSDSGILGIDYSYISSEGRTQIYLDGTPYPAPISAVNYEKADRHILAVNESCEVHNTISVMFNSKATAELFNGLIFS